MRDIAKEFPNRIIFFLFAKIRINDNQFLSALLWIEGTDRKGKGERIYIVTIKKYNYMRIMSWQGVLRP